MHTDMSVTPSSPKNWTAQLRRIMFETILVPIKQLQTLVCSPSKKKHPTVSDHAFTIGPEPLVGEHLVFGEVSAPGRCHKKSTSHSSGILVCMQLDSFVQIVS